MKNEIKIQEYTENCLNCKMKPCSQKGCPLSNDIPTFIKLVKEGEIEEAYQILIKTTFLGSICGRICPHEKQCQGSCIRGIKGEPVQIGKIESYIFDIAIENEYYKSIQKTNELKGKKIAVIGSGPASLNCSAFLALEGADVTIYEKHEKLGGLLRYGIPEFRLSKDIVDQTIHQILSLGIKVITNIELGKDITLEKLKDEYDAIFIGIGANVSCKMNIVGEELEGVLEGNTLLETNCHPNYKGKKVSISGGGNVAIDCARTIKRLGAEEVTIIYRRAEKQMPAEKKEIENAKNEGINFLFQNRITKILGKEKVQQIECIKTELVKKEGEKREVPIDVNGSNYLIDTDYIVIAIGSKPQGKIINKLNLKCNEWGYLEVNERYQTSDNKVYAGGDLIGQKATIAWAAKSGIDAVKSIIEDLGKK